MTRIKEPLISNVIDDNPSRVETVYWETIRGFAPATPIEVTMQIEDHIPNLESDSDISLAPSVSLGSFLGFDDAHQALVDFPEKPSDDPIPALTCVPLSPHHAGCEVALAFVNGSPSQPVVLGILQRSVGASVNPAGPVNVHKSELSLSADNELIIECGKASITLTREGRIILRGEYLVSQSTGLNVIEGAVVQIN